jgi:threonylcarbamoyladenosine tRNA methylthiotransferase MtaB
VRNGTREIVLTGVNTGDWGRGLDGKHSFIEVVKALDEIEGLERVRISSIEPNLLTDEILEFISTSRSFVHHFHVPLQSGSDNTLRAMKRRYNTDGYRARIDKIKSLMSDACIGADVIVGFPTESDSDFNETLEFIKSLPLSYLHVFTYSERENTPAAQMEISVPHTIRSERSKILHSVGEEKRTAFYREHIGTIRPVLWESDIKDGYITGFTDNYIKVKHPYVESLPCSITYVSLTGIDADGTMMCKDI